MKLLLPALLAALVLLTGCAVTRHIVAPYDQLTLQGAEGLNPDAEGRASPLSVRVYEMSDRGVFDSLDFNSIFYNAASVLGDELLSSSEHVVLPNQTLHHRIELQRNTRYIALVAAYRNIDAARWRVVYPVNSNWYYSRDIRLDADAIVVVE